MQRKYPALISDSHEHSSFRGFTLLEVLVALLVFGLLAVSVGQAVFLSLLAERRSDAARDAAFYSQTLAVHHWQEQDKSLQETLHAIGGTHEQVDVDVGEDTFRATLYQVGAESSRSSQTLMLWTR